MGNVFVINGMLLLIALLWGLGFIPQREGMEYMSPFLFNALRFSLGTLTLLPFLFWLLKTKKISRSSATSLSNLTLGLLLGILLFAGASFQQIALKYTTLTNVAFITSLYTIIIPLLGYFIGYRYKLIVWAGSFIAIGGLALLQDAGGEVHLKGDIFALIGAVFWASHLLLIAEKVSDENQISISFYQFIAAALLSFLTVYLMKHSYAVTDPKGYIWVTLNGVFVVGIGYTLMVVMLKYAEPFSASLIFMLEAVFAAMAGYFFYHEQFGVTALIGVVMILTGCAFAQWPNSSYRVNDKP